MASTHAPPHPNMMVHPVPPHPMPHPVAHAPIPPRIAPPHFMPGRMVAGPLYYRPHPSIPPPVKRADIPVNIPPTFDSAPQRDMINGSVKACINDINEIIDLLNKPIATKGDVINMDYAPETVTTFRVLCTEAQHNLEAASATACSWFTAVGAHLDEITNTLSEIESLQKETDENIVKNKALIEANVKSVQDMMQNMAHEKQVLDQAEKRYRDAQGSLNNARAEQSRVRTARKWLCWVPIVAAVLTVVDIVKEQNDVRNDAAVVHAETSQVSKDQQLLSNHSKELKDQREEGIKLEADMTGLQTKERELNLQKEKLEEDSKYLGPLKINIDHCIHTVSGALGSAENLDNMMSMKNVGDGIKGLVSDLKNDGEFAGTLATMNDAGYADLDKKIAAIQKAQKANKKTGNLGV